MRSSAASFSVVKRGQFDEYEQHAPQAWQGLSACTAGWRVSMPLLSPERSGRPAGRARDRHQALPPRERTEHFGNPAAYVDRIMLQSCPDFAWAPLREAA